MFHWAPPSVVATIAPESPTAKQTVVLGQLTPYNFVLDGAGDGWKVHEVPPSIDARMFGGLPTAKHTEVLGQLMARIRSNVNGDWTCQPVPPLLVATISP